MATPIPTTQQAWQAYQDAQNQYGTQATGATSFLTALQAALAGADPANQTLQKDQASLQSQQYTAPTDYRTELINSGVTDPYQRAALMNTKLGNIQSNLSGVNSALSNAGATRQQAVNTASKAYDAQTAAALAKEQAAGTMFQNLLASDQDMKKTETQNAFTALQASKDQAFQAQQNELNRKNALAVAGVNHSSSTGGFTPTELASMAKDNPRLFLSTQGLGKAVPDSHGGFSFFDAQGQPITAQQAAALVPGSSVASLLTGSTNSQDAGLTDSKTSATQVANDKAYADANAAIDQLKTNAKGISQKNPLMAATAGNIIKLGVNSPLRAFFPTNQITYSQYLKQVPGLFLKAFGVNRVNQTELNNIIGSIDATNLTSKQSQAGIQKLQDFVDNIAGQKRSTTTAAPSAGKTSSGITYTVSPN